MRMNTVRSERAFALICISIFVRPSKANIAKRLSRRALYNYYYLRKLKLAKGGFIEWFESLRCSTGDWQVESVP